MRAVAVAALGFLVAAVGCAPSLPSSYTCASSSQCVYRGTQGACEPTGACSFPDVRCGAGRRYGDFAPPGLAGVCVGEASDGGGGHVSRFGAATLPLASHGSVATLASPGTLAAGDLLFACIFLSDPSVGVTTPGGWTSHADLTNGMGSPSPFRAVWLYRVAGASEPASYDFTLGGTPAQVAGALVAYRGVASSAPIDTSTNQAFMGPGRYTAPSITTSFANDMLLAMFVDGTGSGFPLNAPAGMGTATSVSPIGMFDALQSAPGPTGDKQASLSFGSIAIGAVDFVALKPGP
jgi:hypothetical protein